VEVDLNGGKSLYHLKRMICYELTVTPVFSEMFVELHANFGSTLWRLQMSTFVEEFKR